MKRLGLIFLLALGGAWAAVAQDPAPTPTPAPAPGTGQNGLPDIESLRGVGSSANLIPGLATPPPPDALTPPGSGAGHRRGGGGSGSILGGSHARGGRSRDVLAERAAADPLTIRVAYRRDKTEALRRNPALIDLLQQADAADTEARKRAALKEYYVRLFEAVQQVDSSPEMKTHVKLLGQIASQRYDPQRRAVGGDEELVRGQGGRRGRGR